MAPTLIENTARPRPASLDGALAALGRGARLVCSSARAARALRRAYADQMEASGASAWEGPAISDWTGFLDLLWEQLSLRAEAPLVLTPMQEQQVWRRVQELEHEVVAPGRMADLAAEAYRLLGSYRAHGERRAPLGWPVPGWFDDAARFQGWAGDFDRRCEEAGWLAASRRDELLAEALETRRLRASRELLLVGFDRVTPAQQHLLRACARQGTRIERAEIGTEGSVRLLRAPHSLAEATACAAWARARLDANPRVRLGVLAPDLEGARPTLDRALREQLRNPALWEFSLGTPLADAPTIHAALLLLHWTARPLTPDESAWLLNSGFCASSPSESAALAAASTRAAGRPTLLPGCSLPTLLQDSLLPRGARAQLEAVGAFARANRLADTERTASAWADLVPALLRLAGWPGYREQDSAAFQAARRWEQLLDSMALLSFDGSRLPWPELLQRLEAHARATLFNLESEDAPIQVLGAFEASGLHFDAAWFLGADDGRWPGSGRSHPLLPPWLARAAGMPHSAPEVDWELSSAVTRRVAGSAPDVTFSYAEADGELERRPSPLLAALFPALEPAPCVDLSIPHLPAPLEELADDSGTLPWPTGLPAGGADTLRRQAACGFQAFARKRLQLREQRESELGLDPLGRGTLLHEALERLWSPAPEDLLRLHSDAQLCRALEDGTLLTLVAHHVDEAIHAHYPAPDQWTDAYLRLERVRLASLIEEWLRCEAKRAPFTVEALEQHLSDIAVAGLRLNLRADRVDRLADGTRLLIDYKSGLVKASKWDTARPDEPQLPLYFVHGGLADVSGIAFAQVRARQTRLIARAARPDLVQPGSATNVERLQPETEAAWAEVLAALATAFQRGEATLNPSHGAGTCKLCRLQPLCRIQSTGSMVEASDSGEPAEED